MKAPDKIYLHGYSFDDEPCKAWEREPKVKGMRGYPAQHAEYIRKDLLLEWAKAMKILCEEHPACEHGNWHDGNANAYGKLIYKLNSL